VTDHDFILVVLVVYLSGAAVTCGFHVVDWRLRGVRVVWWEAPVLALMAWWCTLPCALWLLTQGKLVWSVQALAEKTLAEKRSHDEDSRDR
jgi:hypothetical protein